MDKTISFVRKVAEVVHEFTGELRSFTAYDVTQEVRSRLAYRVDHQAVRPIAHACAWGYVMSDLYSARDKSFPTGQAILYYPDSEGVSDLFPNPIPVESSFIDAVAYEPDRELLLVVLINGNEYVYSEIDAVTFARFLNAPSKGGFYNKHVKNSGHQPFIPVN